MPGAARAFEGGAVQVGTEVVLAGIVQVGSGHDKVPASLLTLPAPRDAWADLTGDGHFRLFDHVGELRDDLGDVEAILVDEVPGAAGDDAFQGAVGCPVCCLDRRYLRESAVDPLSLGAGVLSHGSLLPVDAQLPSGRCYWLAADSAVILLKSSITSKTGSVGVCKTRAHQYPSRRRKSRHAGLAANSVRRAGRQSVPFGHDYPPFGRPVQAVAGCPAIRSRPGSLSPSRPGPRQPAQGPPHCPRTGE